MKRTGPDVKTREIVEARSLGAIPCGCGCGEMIRPLDSRGRPVRFARNHYTAPHLADAWRRLKGPDDPENAECWVWPGATNNRGYGSTKQGGENYVHRVAWIRTYGLIPDDLNVLHKCDNPPCFRPSHLFLGTQADNVADMVQKGRWHGYAPPPLDEEALKAAYLAGASLRSLPGSMRCSMRRARQVLLTAGIEIRKNPSSWKRPLSPTCGAGHRYDAENTYIAPKSGARGCRKCRAAYARNGAAKIRSAR